MLYHYPKLSTADFGLVRSPGAGLGNLLFPIMRALIGQRERGGAFVYPTFPQVKLGTLLRAEQDRRFYFDVARGRTAGEWRDWLSSRFASPIVSEQDGAAVSATDGVIAYEGLGRYFHDLAEHESLVIDWCSANLRDAEQIADCDVAVHIRMGDFDADPHRSGEVNTRSAFTWYRDALAEAGFLLGLREPRVIVFTDGAHADVRAGLGRDDLRFDESPQAAAAILGMSRAKIIVTSNSTFSMWSAFLGRTAAIWNERFDYEEFFPSRPGLDVSF